LGTADLEHHRLMPCALDIGAIEVTVYKCNCWM